MKFKITKAIFSGDNLVSTTIISDNLDYQIALAIASSMAENKSQLTYYLDQKGDKFIGTDTGITYQTSQTPERYYKGVAYFVSCFVAPQRKKPNMPRTEYVYYVSPSLEEFNMLKISTTEPKFYLTDYSSQMNNLRWPSPSVF